MADLVVEPTSSDGPRKSMKPRVLRANFGDGYSQRAGDGINLLEETWSVEWENLDSTEVVALETQLEDARGVDAITWTPHGESTAKKFTISQWDINPKVGNVGVVWIGSAILTREYDLG